MSLIVGVLAVLENLPVHRIDVGCQCFTTVLKIFKADLKSSSLVISLQYFFLCLCDSNLANLVFLLQVDNELVLTLDDGLVFIEHLLGLLALALVIARHVLTHVVEGMKLLVQTSDLVILDNDELIQLFNFFLGVSLLSLVTLEHGEKTVNAFIAGIA